MPRIFCSSIALAALALTAACASNSDPPRPLDPAGAAPSGAARSAPPPTVASIDARDVAVLVVEQTPSALRVASSARRPRASFGPRAAWNGAGAATHRWTLRSATGAELASGDIVARAELEVPPDPAQGLPAAHAQPSTIAFMAKVPQPEPGEAIEITTSRGPALAVRWP